MPPTRSLAQAGGGVGPRAPAPVLAAASGPKPSMSEQEGRTRCAGRLPPAAAHSTQGRTRGSGGDAASAGRLPPAAASDSRTSVSGRRLRIVSATPSLPAAASGTKSRVSEREVRTICAGRLPPAAAHRTRCRRCACGGKALCTPAACRPPPSIRPKVNHERAAGADNSPLATTTDPGLAKASCESEP